MTKVLVTLRHPKRYGDCQAGGINAARPCPYKTCKHHIKNQPTANCALDRIIEGHRMTVPEIAEALGETEEAVEKTLQRALDKLRKSKVLREFYER